MRIECRPRLSACLAGAAASAIYAAMVLVPVSSAGAERIAQAGSQNEAQESPSETPKDQATEESEDGKKSTSRRKKFRPSERITADTAVSFPVDI